ncbi:hypothetical protein LJR099_004480 [Variovorax paradoxus]|uniref:hypothetical protein n=1 Tax=Variovorax paradoxus TaxID=34073 RepID=UPI00399AA528
MPLHAAAAELSGTFVGGGRDFVVVLQILPAGEGKIVGRLRTTSFDTKGVKHLFDRSVSGAASGDSFIGKLEGNWDNGGTVAISGSLSSGTLNVSAANGLNVSLRRGEEQDFNRIVELLANKSNTTQQENAQRDSAKRTENAINATVSRIKALRFDIGLFANAEPRTVEAKAITAEQYRGLTQQIRDKVEQLEQITQPGLGSVSKRYVLQADMSRAETATLRVASEVFDAQKNFETQAAKLNSEIGEAQRACGVPGGTQALRQECVLLPASSSTFEQVNKGVGDSYRILRDAWQKAKVEQQELSKRTSAFMTRYQYRR